MMFNYPKEDIREFFDEIEVFVNENENTNNVEGIL